MNDAMENSVPVVSRKSMYRKVTSAIHSSPVTKPWNDSFAPVALSDGQSTTLTAGP